MKEEIRQLFEECISRDNEEELENLKNILKGVQNKQLGINTSYIGGLLHMERTINDHVCEVTIPLYSYLNNSLNIVHGGITATLLDSAMGNLANSLLPVGYTAVTSQLNVHYISVGKGEYLTCKAEVSHKGTKVMLITGDVYRSDGRKIAHATGTFFIIEKKE
ncbi:PaaI family thioesterase [Bacillus sp. CGMCC 1.16607]|uniref:PaaI family thioesterase n=1 Tax=Bacillus sp. CGMCC 1.16607 TaxID=3351842 RepID=UPI0036291470